MNYLQLIVDSEELFTKITDYVLVYSQEMGVEEHACCRSMLKMLERHTTIAEQEIRKFW